MLRLAVIALLAQIIPQAVAAQATREVTDAAGRVVTLPTQVNRVADAWHANNAVILMLGGADKIAATTAQAQRQPWLRRLYPRIDQVPAAFNTAGDLNIETLVGAKPDVILMAYDGTMPKWSVAVDALHIPIVMMPNTSLAGLKETVRITGQVLGESEARVATRYLRYFDDNVRRVTTVTGRLLPDQRPKVLHTASAGILTVTDVKASSTIGSPSRAGAMQPTSWVLGRPVTLEQIAAWDPEVIIVRYCAQSEEPAGHPR